MTAVATMMPPVSTEPPFGIAETFADESLAAEIEERTELIYGRVVERQMASESNIVAGRFTTHLSNFTWAGPGGAVIPEQSFRCFPNDPEGFRRPDVVYIAGDRAPARWPPGHLPFRPDIAVEVVSPTDNVDELELKLADYRSAEIPLVWVAVPATRVVRVYRRGGPPDELFDGDTLRGDPVLPGFAVAVSDLFPPRPAAA